MTLSQGQALFGAYKVRNAPVNQYTGDKQQSALNQSIMRVFNMKENQSARRKPILAKLQGGRAYEQSDFVIGILLLYATYVYAIFL